MSTIKIAVNAIVTVPGYVTQSAVVTMLADASSAYSAAGVTFELATFETDPDPLLSNDPGGAVPIPVGGPPLNLELPREARAARYPGGVVVFFRPGGGSYSSSWGGFVVMADAAGMDFAHEVGHFLHLGHTFVDGYTNALFAENLKSFESAKALAIQLIASGGGLGVFDGDYPDVKDTPPDPGPPLFQPSGYTSDHSPKVANEHCSTGPLTLDVGGTSYVLAPDRMNIMSYFMTCPGEHNISPDQISIVQDTLTRWNRRHLVDGALPEGPAAVLAPDGHIHVFARGDDTRIWQSTGFGGIWNGWTAELDVEKPAATRLGPTRLISGPAAVLDTKGEIHVFALARGRNLWQNSQTGKGWSGWSRDSSIGTFTSAPSAVLTKDGRLHIFARGDDRNIWHRYWDGQWSAWSAQLGTGSFTSGPSAVAVGPSEIHVFARGGDRNVWRSIWDGNKWSGWFASPGVGTSTSAPAAVSIDGQIHLFARDDDRGVQHNVWNGLKWSGWNADMQPGTFLSGFTAIVTPPLGLLQLPVIHVFAIGDDRTIAHSFWDGKVWSAWTSELGDGTFQP
jgi:hypothetical protein